MKLLDSGDLELYRSMRWAHQNDYGQTLDRPRNNARALAVETEARARNGTLSICKSVNVVFTNRVNDIQQDQKAVVHTTESPSRLA